MQPAPRDFGIGSPGPSQVTTARSAASLMEKEAGTGATPRPLTAQLRGQKIIVYVILIGFAPNFVGQITSLREINQSLVEKVLPAWLVIGLE